MRFEVLFSEDAERDIEDIYRYIAASDGVASAERVLSGIEAACLGLSELPHRGHCPKELLPLGIRDYHEVHFKPYRIVYRITGRRVVIYCVLDGRRDMQSLLHERLVR